MYNTEIQQRSKASTSSKAEAITEALCGVNGWRLLGFRLPAGTSSGFHIIVFVLNLVFFWGIFSIFWHFWYLSVLFGSEAKLLIQQGGGVAKCGAGRVDEGGGDER